MVADLDRWKRTVWETAPRIGDANYQRLTWIEHDQRFISTPTEMYNVIFGDVAIEALASWPGMEFTDAQKGCGAKAR